MDKKKYSIELRAKELEDSEKKRQKQSMDSARGQALGRSAIDSNMKKLQRENALKEKEINRLQDQLDKAYGRHS